MRFTKILGVWATIAGLLFWNGALGIGVWNPLLGRAAGEMMTAFLGMAIVTGAARPFLIGEPEQPRSVVFRISMLWLVFSLVFEIGLGRLAQFVVPTRAPLYGMWDGSFWPLIVMTIAFAPFVWLRRSPVPVGRVTK